MNRSSQELIDKIYASQHGVNCQLPGPYGDRYITYADYIASGKPISIIEDYITDVVLPSYANTHTESSYTGSQTSHFREEARGLIRKSVNASEKDAVIFRGAGCTAVIDLMYNKLLQKYEGKEIKPTVFIGPFEHHSNLLPWREGPFDVVEIPLCPNGNVDMNILEGKLKELEGKKPLIGSFSAASNVTGIIAPIEEITTLLKKFGALSFWDYAGAAPYVDINMNPDGGTPKDAIFISPHKLIGGPGTPGLLIVKKEIFENTLPVTVGGGTVKFVSKTGQTYIENIEEREEGGTPDIIGSIRAGMAFKLKDEVGVSNIVEREEDYIQRALKEFEKHANIDVLGNLKEPRLGFMPFNIRFKDRHLHYNFVVALLNDLFGIQSRGGCSCAGPYGHDLLELNKEQSAAHFDELYKGNVGSRPGWVRLNFNYFIPEEEFQFLIDAIVWVAEHGWKLLKKYHFDDNTALWVHGSNSLPTLNTLSDFIHTRKILKHGSARGKRRSRKKYFVVANQKVDEAIADWNLSELQSYNHEQVNNPLRWYALADDAQIEIKS